MLGKFHEEVDWKQNNKLGCYQTNPGKNNGGLDKNVNGGAREK